MSVRHFALVALVFFGACGGGGGEPDGGDTDGGPDGGPPGVDPVPPDPPPATEADGFVTFISGRRIYRIAGAGGSSRIDLSARIENLSGGTDAFVAVSKNGQWMTTTSTRFGCPGDCLALYNGDGTAGGLVLANGATLSPDGRAAVSDDGNLIVYPDRGGGNSIDLFAVRRQGAGFGAPELLTGGSNQAFNDVPVLSRDGSRVIFDCGPTPFSQRGTNICEVSVNGGGFRMLIDSSDDPIGGPRAPLTHHADTFADGSLVFEAEWGAEQLWIQRAGAAGAFRINPEYGNDNSPCVLPGGYVASLWLNRPGGPGFHELKIMAPNGEDAVVLTPGTDITDLGISCHQ
jgi:hypothetical protein